MRFSKIELKKSKISCHIKFGDKKYSKRKLKNSHGHQKSFRNDFGKTMQVFLKVHRKNFRRQAKNTIEQAYEPTIGESAMQDVSLANNGAQHHSGLLEKKCVELGKKLLLSDPEEGFNPTKGKIQVEVCCFKPDAAVPDMTKGSIPQNSYRERGKINLKDRNRTQDNAEKSNYTKKTSFVKTMLITAAKDDCDSDDYDNRKQVVETNHKENEEHCKKKPVQLIRYRSKQKELVKSLLELKLSHVCDGLGLNESLQDVRDESGLNKSLQDVRDESRDHKCRQCLALPDRTMSLDHVHDALTNPVCAMGHERCTDACSVCSNSATIYCVRCDRRFCSYHAEHRH